MRAHRAVNDQFDMEEAWDRDGAAARDWEPERRQLLALDRTGDLRRSWAAAERAAALARTPDEQYWLANLMARLECDLGHYDRELQQARKMAALAPRSSEARMALWHAARCLGLPEGKVRPSPH